MAHYTVTTYSPAEHLRRLGFANGGPCEPAPRFPRVLVSEIQSAVCQHFSLPLQAMTSPCRARDYARPRQIAMYLCRLHTRCSLPDLGRRFDRDHSTVLHAVRHIGSLRRRDENVERDVNIISRVIGLRAQGLPK
jgi:chromosomal replication initiation ATPase DnaA